MTTRPLKVGLLIPPGTNNDGGKQRWAEIKSMAAHAEAAGFDSLWFPDHMFLDPRGFGIEDDEGVGMWECWSMLSAIGAVTTQIELGTFVACTNFRNPALLAKTADTIDEITGGRLILGLGAGYHEPELRAFGYPEDHLVGRFEEALMIITSLLRKGRTDFQGKYYTVRDCDLSPRGPRQAGPPILIGAKQPRTLRLTARFADAWNTSFIQEPDKVAELREKVDAACLETNRDPATLERTIGVQVDLPGAYAGRRGDTLFRKFRSYFGTITGSPEEIASRLKGLSREGVAHLQISLEPCTMAAVDALTRVLELLDEY